MKINVIGVPLNLGCDREGVERAPNHLRERGLMRIIRKNGHRAFDLGNLYVPLVSEADKFARGRSLKYLDAIVEVNNNLAELVYDTLRGGAFPLVMYLQSVQLFLKIRRLHHCNLPLLRQWSIKLKISFSLVSSF